MLIGAAFTFSRAAWAAALAGGIAGIVHAWWVGARPLVARWVACLLVLVAAIGVGQVLVFRDVSAQPRVVRRGTAVTETLKRGRVRQLVEPMRAPQFVGRLDLWRMAVKGIAERPLLGHGVDTLPLPGGWWGRPPSPHNMYLAIAYSRGIPALAAFGAVLLALLLAAWRLGASAGAARVLGLTAIAGLVAFCVAGVFSALVSYRDTGALFWFVAALIAAAATGEARARA
jgi:O-antigen ligase